MTASEYEIGLTVICPAASNLPSEKTSIAVLLLSFSGFVFTLRLLFSTPLVSAELLV